MEKLQMEMVITGVRHAGLGVLQNVVELNSDRIIKVWQVNEWLH